MRCDGKNSSHSNKDIDAVIFSLKAPAMGPDLTDKRWIVAKGILFSILALLAGIMQLAADLPVWQEVVLLCVCVWASCRFYYFLFHCLHAYVDPGMRSAGILDLLGKMWRRRG